MSGSRSSRRGSGGDEVTSGLGRRRRISEDTTVDLHHSQETYDYNNNDDLNIRAEERNQGIPKDDHITEETFCTNFLCCGVQLPDLHALLQHYEDVHVKIARERGGVDQDGLAGEGDGEDGEEQELDVVGTGGFDQAQVPSYHQHQSRKVSGPQQQQQQQQYLAAAEYRQHGGQRPDSVQSFGSVSAADALLGVGLPYTSGSTSYGGFQGGPTDRPRTADLGPPPPGYAGSNMYLGPQQHYYAPPPMPHYYQQQPRGEQPVSAFDTTILRSVSPAPGAYGYYQHPAMQQAHMAATAAAVAGAYYHPAYGMMVQHPSGIQSLPSGPSMHQLQQQQQQQQHQQYQQHYSPNQAPQKLAPKRPKSAIAPSIKAVAHASTTLRESLPSSLSGQKDQFKLVYNILSNTIEAPRNNAGVDDDGHPSAAEALLSMDPKGKLSANAAAVLALPRAPIDKTLERPYICPVPGCGKAYKNPNGLKYHAAHGHDAAQEAVERPYKCPYGNCGNRYKNPNGLKYHVNKHHADMLPKSAVIAKAANAAKEAAAAALMDLEGGHDFGGNAFEGHHYDEDEETYDRPDTDEEDHDIPDPEDEAEADEQQENESLIEAATIFHEDTTD